MQEKNPIYRTTAKDKESKSERQNHLLSRGENDPKPGFAAHHAGQFLLSNYHQS
jgi:hypothetical protein